MEPLILPLTLLVSTVALILSSYHRHYDWRVKIRAVYEDAGDGAIIGYSSRGARLGQGGTRRAKTGRNAPVMQRTL